MAGSKYIRHPALPFSIVKWEEETGFVYITAGGVTDVRRAASIHVAELLERQDFLARLPADQVERVKAFAATMKRERAGSRRCVPLTRKATAMPRAMQPAK